MLCKTKYKEKAMKEINLLIDVTKFKMKFYRCNWANYETILNYNIKLIPDLRRINELKKDYIQMKEMLYGEIPTFEDILKCLIALEKEINQNLTIQKNINYVNDEEMMLQRTLEVYRKIRKNK